MSSEQIANARLGSDALVDALAKGGHGDQIGGQLFDLAALLLANPALLRGITDPGRSAADRTEAIHSLIVKKVLPGTEEVMHAIVGLHWANPDDLVYTLRQLGVEAKLRDAKQKGTLEQVGQELIDIGYVLQDNRDVRTALSPLSGMSVQERQELAQKLFGAHISDCTSALLEHAVASSRPGRLIQKLRNYARTGAVLEGSRLVMVRTAEPFTAAQRARLQSLLERQVHQPVTLGVVLDPELIGGFRVSYGDEAFDSSVRADVAKAKQALAR